MIPGINQRQMKQMMRRMGMEQSEIEASEVIIKTPDKILVFENPQVSKVNAMGQETYQVVGTPHEQANEATPIEISDEDIETVVSQTNVSEEKAKNAILENDGDLAATIMQLKGDDAQ